MPSKAHSKHPGKLTRIAAATAISATTMQPGHAGLGLPLPMAGHGAEFLFAMSELARATIAAFPNLVPVPTHLCFVESVRLLVQMPGRKTARSIADRTHWNNRDEGTVLAMAAVQDRVAASFISRAGITTIIVSGICGLYHEMR